MRETVFFPSRILVVKSGRRKLFEDALRRLRELFPGASISSVILSKMKRELDYKSLVEETFVLAPEFDTYCKRAAGRKLKRELKQRRFDLAVALYANGDGGGYENVRDFLRALPVRQHASVNGSLAFAFVPAPGVLEAAGFGWTTRALNWLAGFGYGAFAVPWVLHRAERRSRGRV